MNEVHHYVVIWRSTPSSSQLQLHSLQKQRCRLDDLAEVILRRNGHSLEQMVEIAEVRTNGTTMYRHYPHGQQVIDIGNSMEDEPPRENIIHCIWITLAGSPQVQNYPNESTRKQTEVKQSRRRATEESNIGLDFAAMAKGPSELHIQSMDFHSQLT